MRCTMRQRDFVPKEITVAPDKAEHAVWKPDGGVRIGILLGIVAIAKRHKRRIATRKCAVVKAQDWCHAFERLPGVTMLFLISWRASSSCHPKGMRAGVGKTIHGKMASMT